MRNRSEQSEGAAPSKPGVQFMVKVLNPVTPRPTPNSGSSTHTGRPPPPGPLHSTRVCVRGRGGVPRELGPSCARGVWAHEGGLCDPQARRVLGYPPRSPRLPFATSTVHIPHHRLSTGMWWGSHLCRNYFLLLLLRSLSLMGERILKEREPACPAPVVA